MRPLKEKADIVVSVVKFPQDIDLYQAQKGIDNAKLALKENGILILVAKCRCGIGGKAFADLLGSCDTPKAALEKLSRDMFWVITRPPRWRKSDCGHRCGP